MKDSHPLRVLTNALSPDATRQRHFLEQLQGGDIDWAGVGQLAGHHLMTPALAGTLQRQGLSSALPKDLAECLETLRVLNRERNQMLYRELIEVARTLNRHGVEPLLLKGSIALLPGQYPGAEDRMTGDLDLWVPADCFASVYEEFQRGEYTLDPEHREVNYLQHHHAPPLLHQRLPVKLELHSRILGAESFDQTLWNSLRMLPVILPGTDVRVRVPDVGSRLLHNYLHTQIQDHHDTLRSVYLRPLLEFAQLWKHAADQIDFTHLRQRLELRHRPGFDRYLTLAEHFFGPLAADRPALTWGQRLHVAAVEQSLTRHRWQQSAWWLLYRLPNLPRRLLTPSWYLLKFQALRGGEPL